MSISHAKAIKSAGIGAAAELAKKIPVLDCLIAGAERYYESIQHQQREEFVLVLADKLQKVTENAEWYQTREGQQFAKKVISSAMNAEYADKVEYFANALVNGPSLAPNDPHVLKFVELLRKLSKASLEVLAVLVKNAREVILTGNPRVYPASLAVSMNWHPSLAEACIQELHSEGVLSLVIEWSQDGQGYRKARWTEDAPNVTQFTIKFANFALAQHRS
jgi:hypothetical protein